MKGMILPMTAINASREIRTWLRSHGEDVSDRGAITKRHMEMWYDAHPDQRPASSVRLLPKPDAPDEDFGEWEDIGVLVPDDIDEELPAPGPQRATGGRGAPPPRDPPEDDAGGVSVDPEPAHAKKGWTREPKTLRAAPKRVTAAVRTDIEAKISFALELPGQVWAARDPICGRTFLEQRPDIAEAMTDIVCDSPDLVAFFTGPGGSFMKYLKLAAACWPVATTVMAHHVYHTLEEAPPDWQQPDYEDYAA